MTTEAQSYRPDSQAAGLQATASRVSFASVYARLRAPANVWAAVGVCFVGLALRAYVASESRGTNDIETWYRFSNLVTNFGVLKTYELDRWFNHPPIMGWYAAAVLAAANHFAANFVWVFKVVPILASTATVMLVHRAGRLSLLHLGLFAINPTDVLISAYHGNTDPICVLFCVAAVLLADRERPAWSGLALGAALNIKLIPVVLIAPLALSLKPRQLLWFGAALGLCVLPYVPVYLGPWAAFERNALLYNSFPCMWGMGLFTSALNGRLAYWASACASYSVEYGKPFIMTSSVLIGLLQLWLRVFTRAELCALAFSVFLVFAPGFGVQYLLYPTAFFALVAHNRGFPYIYLSSAFSVAIYYGYWTGTFPAYSDFNHVFDLRMILTGFWLWLWLGRYLFDALRRLPTGWRYAPNFLINHRTKVTPPRVG